MLKKVFKWGALSVLLLLVLIQAVPYDRNHSNPPVLIEPLWDAPQTRELARRACFDCHSNETVWPWYSNLAPMSWLVQQDVDKGRRQLNFSEWDRPQNEIGEIVPQVQQGKMPLWFYVPLHPSARLSADEKQALLRGLRATLKAQRERESLESGETGYSSDADEEEN